MSISVDRAGKHSPQAELTRVGWIVDAELAYEDWLRQGSKLGLAGRNAAWWIGDWLRYGTARYGSKYAAAARTTGYDRQTLMNMVYVATRFEFSRRRENLSWSHHAELAPLDVEEQDRWLERAQAERFSVRDLREMLPSVKQPAGRPSDGHGTAPNIGPRANALKQVPTRTRAHSLERASPTDTAVSAREVVCPHCGHGFTVGGSPAKTRTWPSKPPSTGFAPSTTPRSGACTTIRPRTSSDTACSSSGEHATSFGSVTSTRVSMTMRQSRA